MYVYIRIDETKDDYSVWSKDPRWQHHHGDGAVLMMRVKSVSGQPTSPTGHGQDSNTAFQYICPTETVVRTTTTDADARAEWGDEGLEVEVEEALPRLRLLRCLAPSCVGDAGGRGVASSLLCAGAIFVKAA